MTIEGKSCVLPPVALLDGVSGAAAVDSERQCWFVSRSREKEEQGKRLPAAVDVYGLLVQLFDDAMVALLLDPAKDDDHLVLVLRLAMSLERSNLDDGDNMLVLD